MDSTFFSTESPLPTYGNPPLVETVLSVQFDPIAKMTSAHLGAFWHLRRDEWPRVQIQPTIDPSFESFKEAERWLPPKLSVQFSQAPDIRVQMINANDDRLIQLQRDRLAFNWRRRRGEEYPRFHQLREEFDGALHDLRAFVDAETLGNIEPRQWEVVYVNHIAKGDLWKAPADWPEVLSGLLPRLPSMTHGADVRAFQGQWVFELTPQRGRLYVWVTPARTADKEPEDVLLLRFTARGPIGNGQDLDNGLNLGHRAIVESFDRLISPKARQHWQRHDDTHSF